MSADVEVKDSRLSLSLETIISSMNLDQKKEVLAWLATDAEVIDSVVSHIVGDDDLGWSIGDHNRRQQILEKIEDAQISEAPRYNWKPWDELRQKTRDIRSAEHIYWVIYHKMDREVSRLVLNEFRRLNVDSNYTTKEGSDDIARLEAIIKDSFAGMIRKEPA